jgi:hypothetical protein
MVSSLPIRVAPFRQAKALISRTILQAVMADYGRSLRACSSNAGVFLLAAHHVIEGRRQGRDLIVTPDSNLGLGLAPINLFGGQHQGCQGPGDPAHEQETPHQGHQQYGQVGAIPQPGFCRW